MEIKVVFYHVFHEIDPNVFPEKIDFISNIDDNTTLQELFDRAEQSLADLSEYYYLSGPFSFNSTYLPFIINAGGKVEWNVRYKDAKVKDFITTHKIKDKIIISKIGYPQAGGPGFKEFIQLWNLIYPIFDQFVTVVGLGAIIINAGKWVHSLFAKKNIPPQSHFDLIYSRENWNHFELAELLGISKEDAKQLLKLFGYSYDNSKTLYVQQPISLQLREKLSKINVLDT